MGGVGDEVSEMFDRWARNGHSDLMEREHEKSVMKFLGAVKFKEPFSFLDVGCGSGWVVRMIAGHEGCTRAVGIDKSPAMIQGAASMRKSPKEEYHTADIESMEAGEFDYIFSMESLYYAESVETAVRRIYGMLRPGGEFFCGTDYYAENEGTRSWQSGIEVRMHLLSGAEWRRIFEGAGFGVRTSHVRDESDGRAWRRKHGTLFITGTRPGL